MVVLAVDSSRGVAGPVASILRGRYPDRVFVTYTPLGPRVQLELRTANDSSINLVEHLRRAADDVPVITCGGHPSAAGALLASSDLDSFLGALRQTFEDQGV